MLKQLDTKKKYLISGPDLEEEIIVEQGYMIVYDVCKIKDYEGGDYVPRKARKMDHVVLPMGEGSGPDERDA